MAYSIWKICIDGSLFDGWSGDCQTVKLNSMSIFPAIRYKDFADMTVIDFIGMNLFKDTKFTFYI